MVVFPVTTSTARFAAISVGAGISNWATYYYNTDITRFTINYLGDDPADDPEIAVVVLLENDPGDGGSSAAPVAREIIQAKLNE